MPPSKIQPTEALEDDMDGRTTFADNISSGNEAERLERSRDSRRRYRQRQKDNELELEQRVQETKIEVDKLRLEQSALRDQSAALHALSSYSSSMLAVLTASAKKARSLSDRALEGVAVLRDWAEHQWCALPSMEELVTGSSWTPSDEVIRWATAGIFTPEYLYAKSPKFVDRLEKLLQEGTTSVKAQQDAELKIGYLVDLYTRFALLTARERPKVMETVIRMHLKTLREEAAAGQYVRPLMLQYSPTELAECVDLNDEQKEKLEKHWQHFVKDIRMARSAFGQSTAGVHDRVQAAMATGQYNPTSSAEAAKCFLLTFNAIGASDELLAEEARAFAKLLVEQPKREAAAASGDGLGEPGGATLPVNTNDANN